MCTIRSSGRAAVHLVLGSVSAGGCTCPGGCTWSQRVYLVPEGVPGPRGCTWGVYLVLAGWCTCWGVYLPGGCTWSGGCVPGPGGCTWSRGCICWGVYLPRGVYLVLGGCTWSQEGYLVLAGVVYLPGVYLPRGCTWSGGCVPGPRGMHQVWGVYLPGGVPTRGVYLVWWGWPGPRGCTWSGTPPCGQTHACKNITFATSLRTVTRLHSSRMHTTHSLTISPSMHCSGGDVSAPEGGAWSRGVSALRGCVPGPGGGFCSGGGVVSQHALRQTSPLWTEWQTCVKT